MDAIFARLFPAPKGPHPQGSGDGSPDRRGKDGRRGVKASNEGVLRAGLLAASSFAVGSGLLLAAHRHTSPLALAAESTDTQQQTTTMLPLGSLSVAVADAAAAPTVREPSTGVEFPELLSDNAEEGEGGKKGEEEKGKKGKGKKGEKVVTGDRTLAAVGVRNKNLLGIKNIKVYAYGVYVDGPALKSKLASKYGGTKEVALRGSRWLVEDAIAADVTMGVRLVIFYRHLKMGQVREAFNESLGGRMKELSGGVPQTELLHSFTKWFTNDIKLHRGTVIDITRRPGHVLETKIDGMYMGSTKSALISRALFELYVGDKPFDKKAREGLINKLISVVHS
ncbi:hypothetical protein CLOM_g875 [Closterium sp. NIES-68]|nr:hypothetical protein CLOM_g875 [Closterium sp. NIES-68]GJP65926.1 hypothetical protein CLOP_g22823 [Closterium sp. NIES-67]